ncbi:MAG TPA: hypothetical protein VE398_18925 [Acidobacteriota bacterium]|nr:hypothetical protein [Acidobacteriota bacterium]
MDHLRSRFLTAALALLFLAAGIAQTRKFYPDDPIQAVPKQISVGELKAVKINALFDYFYQTRRQNPRPAARAEAINTLGEVPDSAWFTNRHGRIRMTREQLKRGPGNENVPQPPFVITGAKTEGITPGFKMKDAKGRRYHVKPDPIDSPELASGADVIGSKLFYAIGYNTPENYIVKIRRSEWSIAKDAKIQGIGGVERELVAKDLYDILAKVPLLPDGSFRVVASLNIEGTPLGPFRYEGTRSDDPNDTVPHERRRDLRGLFVFCAWFNHTDTKAANSHNSIIKEGDISYVRHHLIDFGSALGSDGDAPKDARFGNDYQIPTAGRALRSALGLGLYSPRWERADYQKPKAIGRIESQVFDPDRWKPNYPNPAFLNRQPDDEYWAARIVMAFTDEDIRALVETGEYSDPRVIDYLTKTLAQRRDTIGKTYFAKVLPLDSFAVRDGELRFEDLAVKYEFRKPVQLQLSWSRFDNENGSHVSLQTESSLRLPREFARSQDGSYFAARFHAEGNERMAATVYLRKRGDAAEVVGVERGW